MKKFYLIPAILIFCFVLILALKNLKSSLLPNKNSYVGSDGQHALIALGNNNSGQLGFPVSDIANGIYQVQIPNVDQVETGRNFSIVKTDDGRVYSWGGNEYGQLGYKTEILNQEKPKKISGLTDIKKIAAVNNHTLALGKNGKVYSFGSNFSGQLGDGQNVNISEPIEVTGLSQIMDIDAGYKFSIALKEDRTVWGWGASCAPEDQRLAETWWKEITSNISSLEGTYYDPNSDGITNNDPNEYCINEEVVGILSKVPVHIDGLNNVTKISAGYGHVLSINDIGEVYSFGCNTYKQLGRITADKGDNAKPQKIEGLSDIVEVSAGFRHSIALKKDGTLWGWGQNTHGQFGTGDIIDSVTPVKIPIENVKSIQAAHDYTLVIKDDGTVWGWGRNVANLLAPEGTEFVNSPVQIKDLKNITKVSGNTTHVLAIEDSK